VYSIVVVTTAIQIYGHMISLTLIRYNTVYATIFSGYQAGYMVLRDLKT